MKHQLQTANDTPTPEDLFGDLLLTRLRMRVAFEDTSGLPVHTGSAWRGALGWEIKTLICPFTPITNCSGCVIRPSCPYYMLFEAEGGLPGVAETPRGYVIAPDPLDSKGRQTLFITLLGSCTRFLPLIIQALRKASQRGLGASRRVGEIQMLEELQPGGACKPITAQPDDFLNLQGSFPLKQWLTDVSACDTIQTLQLITPVRLRQKGKYTGVMDWPFYLATLARRLESLNCLYNNGAPLGKSGWLALKQQFAAIPPIQSDIRWIELARYSNRQKTKVPMGGLVGQARITTPQNGLAPWWQAAELVHVGKGAAMGWGRLKFNAGA